MRHIRRWQTRFRKLCVAILAVVFLIASAAPVWAAEGDGASSEKSYVLLYTLVVLAVALGLMVVLRPVGRETELKFKVDDQ